MSVTYGFYNSINGDRRYNAIQMSSIFDGIIRDGVFMSIGSSLLVKAESGMTVNVGIGRAWFDHTWTYNDAELPLTINTAEVLFDRIDAVILEINSSESVRANTIKVVQGEPSSTPIRPVLIKNENIKQYPLCYITVRKNVVTINQADITNMVGTSECPFITGLLETINIDALISQWQVQWTNWMNATMEDNANWTEEQRLEFESWSQKQVSDFEAFTMQFIQTSNAFQQSSEQQFNDWFANLQYILDGDVATRLQNEIDALAEKEFNHFYGLTTKMTNVIKDQTGKTISIVETSDEFIATTSFSQSGNKKTILTLIEPQIGNWNYEKKTNIIPNDLGVNIEESYTRLGKK